jgi:hypothetical protein
MFYSSQIIIDQLCVFAAVHVSQELRRKGVVEGAMFQKLANTALRFSFVPSKIRRHRNLRVEIYFICFVEIYFICFVLVSLFISDLNIVRLIETLAATHVLQCARVNDVLLISGLKRGRSVCSGVVVKVTEAVFTTRCWIV